jgi:hypothetical protein
MRMVPVLASLISSIFQKHTAGNPTIILSPAAEIVTKECISLAVS